MADWASDFDTTSGTVLASSARRAWLIGCGRAARETSLTGDAIAR